MAATGSNKRKGSRGPCSYCGKAHKKGKRRGDSCRGHSVKAMVIVPTGKPTEGSPAKSRMQAQYGGGKRSHRDKRRENRRTSATQRQAAYDALSHEEKLARAGAQQKKRLLAAAK